MPCSQNIRVNSCALNKLDGFKFYQRVFPFLWALDQSGWGRDSFQPGRRSFSEIERILAGERSVVIEIKVEVFCFSNDYVTIC